jgi:hypothetical protein
MSVEVYDPKINVIDQKPNGQPDAGVEDAPNTAEIRSRKFREDLADLGFMSIIEEADNVASETPLTDEEKQWNTQFDEDPFMIDGTPQAERRRHVVAFVLLLRALHILQQNNIEHRQAQAHAFSGDTFSKANEVPQESQKTASGQNDTGNQDQTGATSKPRHRDHRSFASFQDATQRNSHRKAAYETFMHGKPKDTKPPRPDFMPAPSMGDKQEGPRLPFNGIVGERVNAADRQQGEVLRRATEHELQVARDANLMYERALYGVGWRGGDITDEQKLSAYREMGKKYREHGSPEEKEAYQAYLVSQGKPEHVADRKAGHEAKEAAARAETAAERAAEDQPQAARQPETTPQPASQPEQPAQTAPASEAPKTPLAIAAAPAAAPADTSAPSAPSSSN